MADIDYDVPFVPNLKDDTHCVQAVMKMVLDYFESGHSMDMTRIDKVTNYGPEGTWASAALIWLKSRGYDITCIEDFDWLRFSEEGAPYLIKQWGEEVGREATRVTPNMPEEQKLAKQYAEEFELIQQVPTINQIREYLQQRCLVYVSLNVRALNKEPGYVGHAILIKGCTDKELIIHDPGAPPQENRRVSDADFEKAWSYAGEAGKNLTAIKK